MSNHEFDNYLKLISKLLQLNSSQQQAIGNELRDHLQSRVADMVEEGIPEQEAFGLAIEEFGDAAAMAKNFQFVSQLRKRRWVMRFATLSVAGLFLVAVLTMAMWPSGARFGTPDMALAQAETKEESVENIPAGPSSVAVRNAEIDRKLQTLGNFEYDEISWSEIEDHLETEYEMNILLDQSAIDDTITPDEPISIDLRNVPLGHALALMLRKKNATYFVNNGVLVIISLDDASDQRHFELKMFDCRELLEKMESAQSSTAWDNSNGLSNSGEQSRGAAPILQPIAAAVVSSEDAKSEAETSNSHTKADDQTESAAMTTTTTTTTAAQKSAAPQPPQPADMLVSLVQTMIDSDSWTPSGGAGTARVVSGILIINQTASGCEKVARLMQDLNYQLNSQPSSEPTEVGAKVK